MAAITGTIDLSVTKIIGQRSTKLDAFSFQLLSSDLSASATFVVEISLDNTNWDVAETSEGAAITFDLVSTETMVKIIDSDRGVFFRVRFTGIETGNVAYIFNR